MLVFVLYSTEENLVSFLCCCFAKVLPSHFKNVPPVPVHFVCCSQSFPAALSVFVFPRSWELRTQKLKSHLVGTQNLNVHPLKPGIGQYIGIHATLTARDFFLAYFYPSDPFACIFFKPLPIFPVLAVADNWFLCRPAE